jgi:hypothetical protein
VFNKTVGLSDGGTLPLHPETPDAHSTNSMKPIRAFSPPWGYKLIKSCTGPLSLGSNQAMVWILTFMCYAAYHASRKPPSIVKSVLHGDGDAVGGMRRLAELQQAVMHRGAFV